VTIIDGAGDSVVGSVGAYYGRDVVADPVFDKVYVAMYRDSVLVIDGATNQALRKIQVGDLPGALALNPVEHRVYAANYYGSSISVLRDSLAGVEEGRTRHEAEQITPGSRPAIVRGVLWLSPAASHKPQAARLLDASGRKVLDLQPDANDVSRLAPGVYFVFEGAAGGSREAAAHRVVVVR
jgi:YVTN family beta-propeller protein